MIIPATVTTLENKMTAVILGAMASYTACSVSEIDGDWRADLVFYFKDPTERKQIVSVYNAMKECKLKPYVTRAVDPSNGSIEIGAAFPMRCTREVFLKIFPDLTHIDTTEHVMVILSMGCTYNSESEFEDFTNLYEQDGFFFLELINPENEQDLLGGSTKELKIGSYESVIREQIAGFTE